MAERITAAGKKRAGRLHKQSLRQNETPTTPTSPDTPIAPPISHVDTLDKPSTAAQQAMAQGREPLQATQMKRPPRKSEINEHGLNPLEERFAHEYVVDFNGKRAVTRLGLSEKSAHVTASKLLSNPNVWQRCQTLKQEMFKQIDLSHERILRELSIMAFANIADYMVIQPGGEVNLDVATVMKEQPHLMAAITGYEIVEMEGAMSLEAGMPAPRQVLKHKIKMEKIKALELLMKHKKMFEPEDVLTLDQLEELLNRQREDLRRRRAMLQAQLAIENKGAGIVPAGTGIPDIQDAEYETVER